MQKRKGIERSFSYAEAGVDRKAREETRTKALGNLRNHWNDYSVGIPLELPFGPLFPTSPNGKEFLDLEIEGVGTKTLLAELEPESYSSIGIDGVAMVVNDVIRSGARPTLLADAIHVAKSDPSAVGRVIEGVTTGAKLSGCVLSSGETGDVAEVLHERLPSAKGRPFDLMVSCLGIVKRNMVIEGKLDEGDVVIGIESSGLHSNGITLARKLLLAPWGGRFDPCDVPDGFERSIIQIMLEPTRIYVNEVLKCSQDFGLKAAVHITGDGFGKFSRLLNFRRNLGKRVGVQFDGLGSPPEIFALIEKTARINKRTISKQEMYRTFNMGFGFAVVIDRGSADEAIDLFNKYHPARRIGRITRSGKTVISGLKNRDKPVIL